MGCPCSKLEELDPTADDDQGDGDQHNYSGALAQCKQRKDLLRQASVAARAFARSHAEYLQALARTGCALQDFLTAELHIAADAHVDRFSTDSAPRSSFAIEYTPMALQRVVLDDEFLLKPPPPPPGCPSRYWDFDFFQQVEQSIRASASASTSIKEIDGDGQEDDTVIELEGDNVKITDREEHNSYSDRVGEEGRRDSTASAPSDGAGDQHVQLAIVLAELSLSDVEKIFRYVYQEFLRASQSGSSVGAILQSGKAALAWKNGEQGRNCNYGWSQALTLESLSAWELKLYEEVKALNDINTDFIKKRKLLCKYDVNRVHDETVDRTRADVKAIENQMSVAVQAMEATAAAVQKITNEELHFQLLELVQGLADMWKSIQDCHERQKNAVFDLRLPRGTVSGTVPGQKNKAQKLQLALSSWSFSLDALVEKEKEYITSITAWIKASISKLNKLHSLSRRKSRVVHLAIPEIFYLLQEWEKSVIDICKNKQSSRQMIKNLAVAASKIESHHSEELKAQKRVQGVEKELNKKVAGVRNLEKKLSHGKKDVSVALCEKRASVELLSQQLEQEKLRLEDMCASRAAFALGSIESCLPEMFNSASSAARVLAEAHRELHVRGRSGIKNSVLQ